MFKGYQTEDCFDEMLDPSAGIREEYKLFQEHITKINPKRLWQLQHATDRAQVQMGMTFNVYGDDQGEERILHMDIIPRIIGGKEWEKLERGLQQRIQTLNIFIDDLYHDQKVLKDGIVPKQLILTSECYLEQCKGLNPPSKIWSHISGIDLIRGSDGQFYILEDNLRCPSGVSYMLENREILKKTFPEVFQALEVRTVYDYPLRLLDMLQSLSEKDEPTVVLLTPGIYNSAYFEHSYLAREMGVELVEGRDLVVKGKYVYMHTTSGPQQVDVIYRRIDDTFLDPKHFNAESTLGVNGLFDVYRKGNVALANAPGTGVADDKAVYPYVPDLVKYYLDQEILIPNVTTYVCSRPADRKYVLENIKDLVVKETNAAGGLRYDDRA